MQIKIYFFYRYIFSKDFTWKEKTIQKYFHSNRKHFQKRKYFSKIFSFKKIKMKRKTGHEPPKPLMHAFYVGVLPFIWKLKKRFTHSYRNSKKDLPIHTETQKKIYQTETVKRRKVTLFKKVCTSVVMYKLVEGSYIIYQK